MRLFDIIESRDGGISQTKLAAATFHLAIFVAVVYVTWKKGDFVVDMWTLYAAVAVGHSVVDKATAVVQDIQTQKINAGPNPQSVTTIVQKTSSDGT